MGTASASLVTFVTVTDSPFPIVRGWFELR
jgi:hypothetical protein